MSLAQPQAATAHIPDGDEPAYGSVDADLDTVTAWAKANKVNTDGPGSVLGRINTARFSLGLPMFNVVRARAGDQPIRLVKPVPTKPAPVAPVTVASVHPEPDQGQWPRLRTIKDEAELIDLVTSFDGTVTVTCTPALARWILALNTGNRPWHRSNINRFKALLTTGGWVNTGEPLIISREGILNDGQHRLMAIDESGISGEVDIRFGIPRAAFAATGTGTRRTAANVVAISGRPHASALAAVARLLFHYDQRSMGRSNQQVEGAAVLQIIEGEAHLPAVAAKLSSSRFAPTRTASFGLVLAVAARAWPIEKVFDFADLVTSGVAEETSAARRLHVRLRDAAIAKERLHQTDSAALTVRAWNAWIVGRDVHQLKLLEPDRTSEGFPQVVRP